MKNEGTIDRVLRVIVGLAVLSLVIIGPKTLWRLVGLVPLLMPVTGAIGFCPAYKLIGLNSCPLSRSLYAISLLIRALAHSATKQQGTKKGICINRCPSQ